MAKKKRVNPRRIPMAREAVDKKALLEETNHENLPIAWTLVVHAMLKQGIKTVAEMEQIWAAIPDLTTEHRITTWEIEKASKLMGIQSPHPNISMQSIRSVSEIESFKKKAQEQAVFNALCFVCLMFEESKLVSPEDIKRTFANVSLTIAELESGMTSVAQMKADLAEMGLLIEDDD